MYFLAVPGAPQEGHAPLTKDNRRGMRPSRKMTCSLKRNESPAPVQEELGVVCDLSESLAYSN